MTPTKQYHQRILENIYADRLGEAFHLLEQYIEEAGNDNLKTQFITVRSNYALILEYLMKGISDKERPELYRRSARQLLDLADRTLHFQRSAMLTDPISSIRSNWKHNPTNKPMQLEESYRALIADHKLEQNLSESEKDTEISGALRRDQLLEQIFNHCWLNTDLDTRNIETLKALFSEDALPEAEQALLLSGVNLGILLYFNSSRIKLLLELVSHPSAAIRVRAITGIVQAIQRYHKRLKYYPEIHTALKTVLAERLRKEEIEIILFQIIRSQDTEAITRKLRDEIIPEMLKASPRITEKLDEKEFSIEDLGSEENPEWENFFEDSPELMDKIQEFNEMQMDGSDVFMSAFANLKNFPFFNQLHHWFLPFSKDNKLVLNELHKVKDDMDTMKFVRGLESSSFLCNSDKYSFLFNIGHLSSQQLGMLDKYFAAEMEMMNEVQQEDRLLDDLAKFRSEARMYLQDLYRFHKLHPIRRAIPDMFRNHLSLHKTEILGSYLEENGSLRKLAEFQFTRGHYEQASVIFTHLAEKGDTSYEVFEKAGFSYQKVGRFDKALDYYKKAELFDTNHEWLYKKIAYCHRQLGQAKEAIGFYREALKKSPDNSHLMMQLANTLLEAQKFNEALNQYLGIEINHPENDRVIRPIAWCFLNTGKPTQAIEYMSRIPDEEKSWYDWMNLGHMLWVDDQLMEAAASYLKSKSLSSGTKEFLASFDRDSIILRKQGIAEAEIAMIRDALLGEFDA